jgi:hypothetical protein
MGFYLSFKPSYKIKQSTVILAGCETVVDFPNLEDFENLAKALKHL